MSLGLGNGEEQYTEMCSPKKRAKTRREQSRLSARLVVCMALAEALIYTGMASVQQRQLQ